MSAKLTTKKGQVINEPAWIQALLSDPKFSWLWLVVRVWLGYQWIDASLHKIFNPAWVETGVAVRGFWENAVVVPDAGRPAIAFDWYRGFIQMLLEAEAYAWLAPIIAYGELVVGVALVLGLFTGIAAFFGAFMNWNFMMAGAASSNPLLFVAAIGLILAWKIAGYIGLDYYVLPAIGTPWTKNYVPDKINAPASA